MPFADIESDKATALNRIPPVWNEVRRLLPDRPYRTGDPRLLRLRRALRLPTIANTRYRTGQVLRHGPTRSLVERVSGSGRTATNNATGPS